MQRAIPPDLAHVRGPGHAGPAQHEAVGDLHLAADDFSGALEEYGIALRAIGPEAPLERARLLLLIAQTRTARGEYDEALQAVSRGPRRSRGCSTTGG